LLIFDDTPGGAGSALLMRDVELPLPRRSTVALTRAHALAVDGHLRDALAVLDRVRPTDPERAEADRLRADIQRALLALTAPHVTSERDTGSR
jgi:hypothetical protein